MTATTAEVIDFWFGDLARPAATVAGRQAALWWGKRPGNDAAVRARFGALVEAATAGELDDWAASPEGRLALILVTDQFPRNIHRDTPRAFALDDKARALCLEGLEAGDDRKLAPIQRVFFYLPLEHSEDPAHQQTCVDLMKTLARSAEGADRAEFEEFVRFAEAHQRTIERFGRFPHRNAILARPSTPAEIEFLEQPGSSF